MSWPGQDAPAETPVESEAQSRSGATDMQRALGHNLAGIQPHESVPLARHTLIPSISRAGENLVRPERFELAQNAVSRQVFAKATMRDHKPAF